ncbi:origin recognition complex subunit 3 [Ixodes scapularis]
MEDFKSISQACFVSLPRTKKHNKSSREPKRDIGERYTIYQETWTHLETSIQKCQCDAHVDALNSVVSYVQAHNPSLKQARERVEIPTAALIMGVNMSDHAEVFKLLACKLRASVTDMIATVQVKDCSSISVLMQKVVSDIVQTASSDDVVLKKNLCTMSMLDSWYKSAMEKAPCSPSKRQKKTGSSVRRGDPIVVILEDLEGFKPTVLQDFILICSNYIDRLPLVLILGVSTTVNTVHRLVPQRASSCLAIETFTSIPVTEYLSQVFEKVLLDPSMPFKLGPRAFQLIVDVVLFHDFSLTNLLQMLKMCIFEHYYSNSASILCCRQEQLVSVVPALSRDEIQTVTTLPSYQRYLPENKMSPEKTSKKIFSLIQDLHNHHRSSLVLLQALSEFSKKLPGSPLGNHFRELYISYLESPLSETEGFAKLGKLIRVMSIDELQKRLGSALVPFDTVGKQLFETGLQEFRDGLASYKKRLDDISGQKIEDAEIDEIQEASPLDWGDLRSRSQFREKLKDLTKTKKVSPFELLREEFAGYFREVFSQLCPPSRLPLHEVLYYDDAPSLKQYFVPSPRSVLHSALAKPYTYLKCECCQSIGVAEMSPSLPDLSLSYKLHLESGKLINLYDMMQAFRGVKMTTGQKKLSAEEEKLIEAQFFRSVAELQLLGLVKSTQRKTDHVARMTWGSC